MVVGGGGREHAIAWKLAKSSRVATVYVAPGNGGTAREAKVVNVPLGVGQHEALIEFAQSHKIKLCVVGPEAPLIEGLADKMQQHGIPTFGPSAQAAILEASKAYSKVT